MSTKYLTDSNLTLNYFFNLLKNQQKTEISVHIYNERSLKLNIFQFCDENRL